MFFELVVVVCSFASTAKRLLGRSSSSVSSGTLDPNVPYHCSAIMHVYGISAVNGCILLMFNTVS